MKKLKIAPRLELPAEALTKTFMLLGQRGTGKTTLGVVMVEEFAKAGLPFVIVDPLGVWSGIRTSADGKRDGHPVCILGGENGDAPLEPTAGAVVADLIVETPGFYLLDLSLMRKGQRLHFMADFAERLYDAKASHRTPLHIVIDEADEYAPQMARGDGGMAPKVLGAMEDLIRRGRSRGIGMTCITQRPAVLNKNVLSQADVLGVFRLSSPQDRKAIEDWVREHATREQREIFDANLHQLEPGRAFFWSPSWLKIFELVQVRRRETFDSSATPEVGAAATVQRVMARVDVKAITARIAATVDARKAEDPKLLRARIAELQAEIARQPRAETVEVPAISDEMFAAVHTATTEVLRVSQLVLDALARVNALKHPAKPILMVGGGKDDGVERVSVPPKWVPGGDVHVHIVKSDEPGLSKCERAVLDVLGGRDPKPSNLSQVGILSGYSVKSSSLANAISSLRKAGLVELGQPLRLTDAGRKAVGPRRPLPTGRELMHVWCGQLGRAEAAFLTAVFNAHPRVLSKEELAATTGYSITSSSFANALSKLRTLELVEKGSTRLGSAFEAAR